MEQVVLPFPAQHGALPFQKTPVNLSKDQKFRLYCSAVPKKSISISNITSLRLQSRVQTGTPSKAKTLFSGCESQHLPGTATPGAPGSLLGFILADGQRCKETLLGIPGPEMCSGRLLIGVLKPPISNSK